MAGSANNPPPRRIPVRPNGGASSRDLAHPLSDQIRLKVIIQAALDSDKCRNKTLKICVAVEGEEKDRVVVTGNMDPVYLVNKLRKKVSYAALLSVEHAGGWPPWQRNVSLPFPLNTCATAITLGLLCLFLFKLHTSN